MCTLGKEFCLSENKLKAKNSLIVRAELRGNFFGVNYITDTLRELGKGIIFFNSLN